MRLAFFLIVSILFIHESIASAEESWKLEKGQGWHKGVDQKDTQLPS
jgi:hypothetical protein